MNSYHFPVTLILNQTIIEEKASPTLATKDTDGIGFTLRLDEHVYLSVPQKTKQNLDEEMKLIVRNIQQAK